MVGKTRVWLTGLMLCAPVWPALDTRPLTTPLLRYNPNDYSLSDMPARYRYPGGNLYAFFVRSGAAKSAYFAGGHANTDLSSGSASFDAATGDYERFYAQMLFYLAGYRREKCGEAIDCTGLPIVDSLDRLTGESFGSVPIRNEAFNPSAARCGAKECRFEVFDMQGRKAASLEVSRGGVPDIGALRLRPGLYFLQARAGSGPPRISRFLVSPSPR